MVGRYVVGMISHKTYPDCHYAVVGGDYDAMISLITIAILAGWTTLSYDSVSPAVAVTTTMMTSYPLSRDAVISCSRW